VPQAEFARLVIPDKDLRWSEERGHYDFGEINWDEFKNVVKGNGPCKKQRLEARKAAWDNGAWVREAAVAHAAKMKAPKEEKAAKAA